MVIRCSTSARDSSSALRFSWRCSSSGYFSNGNVACGQLKAGISSLWIGFERVVDKLPKRRPWKPVLKLRIESCGAPGD